MIMDTSVWTLIITVAIFISGTIIAIVKNNSVRKVISIISILFICVLLVYAINNISSESQPTRPRTNNSPSSSAVTPANTPLLPEIEDNNNNDFTPNSPEPSQQPTSTSTSPQPSPQPTATPAIALSFGTPVSSSITAQTASHRYSVVLTQTGRLTISITRDSSIGVSSVTVRLIEASSGVQIMSDYTSTTSTSYSKSVDLEAGTYYVEIVKRSSYTGAYNLNISIR